MPHFNYRRTFLHKMIPGAAAFFTAAVLALSACGNLDHATEKQKTATGTAESAAQTTMQISASQPTTTSISTAASTLKTTPTTTTTPVSTTSPATTSTTTLPPATTTTRISVTAPVSSVTESTSSTVLSDTSPSSPPAAVTDTTKISDTDSSATDAALPEKEPKAAAPVALSGLSGTYTYRHLPAADQQLYNVLLQAVQECQTSVHFSQPVSVQKINDLLSLIYFEEYDCRYLAERFNYNNDPVDVLMLNYVLSKETVINRQNALEAAVQKILEKITPEMDDFQKVKLFHDEIIQNCTYTLFGASVDISSAYGALVNGKALCQGYAQAFSLLCGRAGIDNCYVIGYANEAHMWNKVCLDGQWYNVDVTWDDPDYSELEGLILYDYLCVPDASLKSRTVDESYVPLPEATSWQQNYFVRNGWYISSEQEMESILLKILRNSKEAGSRYASVACQTQEIYDVLIKEYFEGAKLLSLISEVYKDDPNVSLPECQIMRDDEMLTAQIVLG